MHELSIALEIERAALAELEAGGGGRLRIVAVAIGERAGVDPDLLAFAWQAAMEAGPHAGCRLDVDFVRARQTCARCGEIAGRQPGSWLRLCPICELPLSVEGGLELDLLELSFEPEPEELEVCR